MKKTIWIVIGVVVLIGAGVLIGQRDNHEAHEKAESLTTEYTEETELSTEAKPPDKPSPKLSDAVLTLIDPETDYQARLAAMRKLGYEIPQHEIDVLMEFLSADISVDVKIPRGAYNSIRNDLYDVLLRQKNLPEGMGDLLVEVVNNPEQDGMWRNYCIQFM
ncbi:MAG: hypothetical protein ABFR47_09930, partial [Verrucomicrobiota bacterium]